MNFNICPSCMAENEDDARSCVACGRVLVDVDTVPAAFDTRPKQFLPASVWDDVDDRHAEPDRAPRAPRTQSTRPRNDPTTNPGVRAKPERPERLPPSPGFRLEAELPVLPELNEPIPTAPDALPELIETIETIELPPRPAPTPAPLPPRATPPRPPGLTRARELPAPPSEPPPPPEPPVVLTPEQQAERDALDARRAARRASVRRSRLRALHRSSPEVAPEVLVVDRRDVDRGVLCGLLQAFGFVTHSLADPGLAKHLLDAHPFVAVFADIALDAADGGDGIELARAVKASAQPKLLVLVTQPLSTIDRVRAELAGFDDVLAKPVARGGVARVLDVHGIVLPTDARRS